MDCFQIGWIRPELCPGRKLGQIASTMYCCLQSSGLCLNLNNLEPTAPTAPRLGSTPQSDKSRPRNHAIRPDPPTLLRFTNSVNITSIRCRSWPITLQYRKTGWIANRSVWFHQNRALIAIQWQSITNTSFASNWTSLFLPCGTQSSKILHNPKSRQRKQRWDNRTRTRITTDVQHV